MRVLLTAILAAPLLSGCVIYSNEAGERDVSVRFGDADDAPLEAVRSARVEDGQLVVRVDSNGCTEAADFELDLTPDAEGRTEVGLRRTDADLCKALVIDGVEVRWALSDLGLVPGSPLRLMNPTQL